MLEVAGARKSFGRRNLWHDLSFSVAAGQMLALVGPSGSGKSTLLNCVGLLEPLDGGRVEMDGRDLSRLGSRGRRHFRRDCLGYLFQNYALVENATVAGNLDIAVGPGRRRRRSYDEALERVGLAGRDHEPVHQLSGGEQQRVALARILVRQPTVVLADEPTGALDRDNAAVVIGLLRELSTEGCAVLIATHNSEVERSCDSTLDLGSRSFDVGPV
jgi:putative ABC transport system ATP-binding protein